MLVRNINASWIIEFLSWGYKISLILSKKMNGLQRNYTQFFQAPRYVNSYNTEISLKPIHLFDKVKLILYPQVRNSMTSLTLKIPACQNLGKFLNITSHVNITGHLVQRFKQLVASCELVHVLMSNQTSHLQMLFLVFKGVVLVILYQKIFYLKMNSMQFVNNMLQNFSNIGMYL